MQKKKLKKTFTYIVEASFLPSDQPVDGAIQENVPLDSEDEYDSFGSPGSPPPTPPSIRSSTSTRNFPDGERTNV